MKHIKLFEQFDDDPFGEESPRIVNGGLKIVKSSSGKLFIGEFQENSNTFKIHFDFVKSNISDFSINPYFGDEELIYVWNSVRGWQKYTYRNLPSEIKNRLS